MLRLKLAYSCPASWTEMPGTDDVRSCAQCDRHVYNLSSKTEAYAKALLLLHGSGELCVRYEVDAQGDVRFAPPPKPPATQIRPARAVACIMAAAVSVAACSLAASTPPPAMPPTAKSCDVAPPVAERSPARPPEEPQVVAMVATDPPSDRDGDRIPDAQDACPDKWGKPQPPGPPHTNGCPDSVRLGGIDFHILEEILFAHGSGKINPRSLPLIDSVATVLQEHPKLRVAVQGHTSIGERSPAKLSAARAQAVVDALVTRGVDPARLVTESRGAAHPVTSSYTAEGLELNRRVSFAVLNWPLR